MICKIKEFESHNSELKKNISKYLELVFEKCPQNEILNKQVLTRFLWSATENDNSGGNVKYLGQPYWSKEAIIHYQKQNSGWGKKNFKDLRHDHSVPKVLIQKKIIALTKKSFDNINEILEEYAHAVVITKEEDKKLRKKGLNQKMPNEFDLNGSILSRYSKAGIEIVKVKNPDKMKEIKL